MWQSAVVSGSEFLSGERHLQTLVTINRKNAHDRPPDWRWQRVGELLPHRTTTPRRDRDHDDISLLFVFRKRLEHANTSDDILAVINRYPDLYTAWRVYHIAEARETRGELEARILAQESVDTIARKVALTCEAVTAYEKYFFNVTDRLDAPGYITHIIFGRSVQTGLAEREYDLLWKMYGYWCGPFVLDAIMYHFNNPSRPESSENVGALLNSDINETLRLRTAMLMRQRPADWERQVEIGNMYMRMLELERNANAGGPGDEAILQNVEAMLNRLPWRKYDLGIRSPDEATTEAERIEMGGFGLRSPELAMFGIGKPPAGIQHLIEGAVYPASKDETNEHDNS